MILKSGKLLPTTIWSILTIIILITLHLKIFEFGDFGVSLAFILIPIWTYFTYGIKFGRFKIKELGLIIAMLIMPFIPGHIDNWSEFFKTYGQYIISYFLVIRVLDKSFNFENEQLDKTLSLFQIILVVTVIFQFILVAVLKQVQFYNIFGKYQLFYELRIIESNLRFKAFYLEPSYLGLVSINLFWIRQQLNSKRIINYNLALTIIILIFAKSAFAFIALFILLIFELYSSTQHLLTKNKRFIIYILIPILILVFNSELFALFRLNELSSNTTGVTSGYMRLILPITIISKIIFIDGFPFGLTFGQLEVYLEQFSVNGYHEDAINNAFFTIIAYWGIIAILGYIIVLYFFLKCKNTLIKSFIILTFINLNNSGAFVPTQFVFIAFLLPLIAIKIYNKEDKLNLTPKR